MPRARLTTATTTNVMMIAISHSSRMSRSLIVVPVNGIRGVLISAGVDVRNGVGNIGVGVLDFPGVEVGKDVGVGVSRCVGGVIV